MTILLACAEDCDLESRTGTVTWNTTGGVFRAGLRGAFEFGGGSTNDPPTNRIRLLPFSSAQSEFWLTWHGYPTSGTGFANAQFVRLLDSSGVCRLIVRPAGSAEVKISTRNDAGTIADLATSSGFGFAAALTRFDLYIKYAGDGTGVITLYVSGAQVLTYSGANTTNGATQLRYVEMSSPNSGAGYRVSEIIAATTDTRGKTLALLNSTTAGNAQQWTGTASNVDQNSLTDDAQYIYTDTANEIQQYKPAALPPGNWTVDGVVMTARAIRGDTGPQNMQFATRIATTDYFSASVQPDTAFSGKQNIQETNPATATAWISADLADTNFQYGLKSIT